MVFLDRRSFLLSFASALATLPMTLKARAAGDSSLKDWVLSDRSSMGRVIHMYGDSISRGYGTGVFSDQMTGAEALYPINAIWGIINQVLAGGGLLTFSSTEPNKIVSAQDVAAYVGPAVGPADAAALISSRVESGIIKAGDVVVFEDAGDHSRDPGTYQANWEAMRYAAAGKQDVTVIMMTMFDYISPANTQLMPDFQYDVAMSDGRTINDATRAAASADLGCVGQTVLIDMNAIMDKEVNATRPGIDVPFMHFDGIHPNVWGEMLMAGEIMKASGLRPSVNALGALKQIVRENYVDLSFGVTGFSPEAAEARVEHCILR